MSKTIELPVYGIRIRISKNGEGAIGSDLPTSDDEYGEDSESSALHAAYSGIEALVLAHACAGVDVESPEYLEGLETAVDAISNHLG